MAACSLYVVVKLRHVRLSEVLKYRVVFCFVFRLLRKLQTVVLPFLHKRRVNLRIKNHFFIWHKLGFVYSLFNLLGLFLYENVSGEFVI